MRRDLFLHFLNRDSREIFELFKLYGEASHFQVLRRWLNAAIVLCEDRCIIPPGFSIEDELAFRLSEQQSAFFRARLLQLPMRESNLTDYAEKKKLEYMPMIDRYSGLFDDRRLGFLGQNAMGIIKRKSRIGDEIVRGWELGPDSKLWAEAKRKVGAKDIEIIRTIPARLANDGVALTWSAIEPNLPNGGRVACQEFRNSLQHVYFEQYCAEFNLVIMTGLSFAHEEFGLPNFRAVYDYHRLARFLDAFELREFLLNCNAEVLVALKATSGFTRYVDAYAQLAMSSPTETDLSFKAQRSRKISRFDWSGFNLRNNLLPANPSALEIRELVDALDEAAGTLVRLNGLSEREPTIGIPRLHEHINVRKVRMARLVFFVALREELELLLKIWGLKTSSGTGPSASGQISGIDVDVVCPAIMGRVPAAVEMTTYLMERKQQVLPDGIVILGLAGGFKKVGITEGDIIVGRTVVDLASRKIIEDEEKNERTKFRRKDYNSPNTLEKYLFETFDRRGWESKAIDEAEWPTGRRPGLKVGAIVSGDDVVMSEAEQVKMLEHEDKLLGVEMEAGGVCAAAERFSVPFYLLRAVSDTADPAKTDSTWRKIGMKTLAILIREMDLKVLLKGA